MKFEYFVKISYIFWGQKKEYNFILYKRVPEKYLLLIYWLCQSLWLCGSQYTEENSERDGNTRPPDPPLEKPICMSGSNSEDWTQTEQQTGSKQEKEYFKAVYCHSAYLTYMQSTSWRRQWHPTPVLLPGKSHGWRSLVGCSPWGR